MFLIIYFLESLNVTPVPGTGSDSTTENDIIFVEPTS